MKSKLLRYRDWAKALEKYPGAKVHFLNYETMKADLEGEIEKLAGFIGKTVSSEEVKEMAQVSITNQSS